MKRWIGRSIIAIGLLHSVFGLVGFSTIWAVLINEGIFNTVDGQPAREAAFWFLFSGFFMLLLGALVDWYESKEIALPPFFGWGLLTIALIGVVVMPISGFWLILIPAIGVIRVAQVFKLRAGREVTN